MRPRWTPVAGLRRCSNIAVYLDAAASHFIVWDKQANAVSFSVLTGIPPEADASYGAYYAAIDTLLQLAVDHSPGAWLRCQEHLDENFVRRNELGVDPPLRLESMG
jgi:hypothetical protein